MRYFVDNVRRLVRTTDDDDRRVFGPEWEQVTGWEYDEFLKENAAMTPTEKREIKILRSMKK